VSGFLSSRPNWVPRKQVLLLPLGSQGKSYSLAGGGAEGGPIPTKGQTNTLVLYVYLVLHPDPELVHLPKVEEDKLNTVLNVAWVLTLL
jgi:hypothetical protein